MTGLDHTAGFDAPSDEGGARRFRDLLTDSVFAPFFYANALSNTGNWFQNVAAGIVVFDLTGSGFLLGVTSTNSELQRGLPEELRGRVMAIWSVAFLGCRPVAAIVDGAIADLTSPRVALGVAGGIAATAAAFMLHHRPDGADFG